MRFNKGHFFSAMTGLIAGALLIGVLPAVAAEGEPMVLGQKNRSMTVTRLNTRGGLQIDNFRAGRTALILNTRDGLAPPMRVNSSALVDGLNTDLLDGFDADQLVRAAYASTEEVNEAAVFGAESYGAILTTEITAPVPGLLVMSAHADAGHSGSGEDAYASFLWVDEVDVAGSYNWSSVNTVGTFFDPNSDAQGVTPVGPGTYTIDYMVSGRSTAVFGRASLWVIFVPFDGTGAVPIP